MKTSPSPAATLDLELAFDVGHSSIGWAVLQSVGRASARAETPPVNLLGCGVVTFGADDCLASKRRQYRQQRRHARATRKRIALMEKLLIHLGVAPDQELKAKHEQACGDSFAWQRAAEILAAARAGKATPDTTWLKLWDILRWYAHNRGYFAPPWANRGDEAAATDTDDEVSDTEKVEHANALMRELGTRTMAETIAAYTLRYEREAAQWQQGQRKEKPKHFKGLNAAFLREKIVWPEVHALLTSLKGRLPKLDDALIRTLLGNKVDPMKDRDAWRALPCPAIKLSGRYHGGLLFGQVIPRFDNRIIGVCPIHYAKRRAELLAAGFSPADAQKEATKQSKLPSKGTPEFLRFRWAMQLANIFGAKPGERETRPLTADERKRLTALAEKQGAFTKGEFKQAMREITGWPERPSRDNLDALLLHPDAEKALVLDPAQREIHNSKLATALAALPERFRKRLLGKLRRGQTISLQQVRDWLTGADADAFDAAVQRLIEAANTKRSRNHAPPTRDELLAEKLAAEYPKGRAPYARPVLRQAYDAVMQGWDPRAEKRAGQPRGCLCQTDELKEAQLQRRLDEQTNNHLIRHRLLILERLQRDLIAAPEFANGDPSRIAGMTIEVASDLRDLSGKTRKEQEQDLGLRLGDFKRVAAKVEEACKRRNIRVTAGIIRKARVAEDLGWRCPYTGKEFCIDTLLDGVMDKEHIIPHADRQSDSLDSLVITWNEVNKWKGKRTAMEFIREEGGKPVPGRPELEIMSLAAFQKHVAGLDTRKGHDDDRARKKRRIRRLLTEHYEEKEFTPRDLTVTSHLVRLGAQVLQRAFPKDQRPPVVSLPGSVTGEVRKAWRLTGCLEAANPAVMEEVEERNPDTGQLQNVRRPKKKDEIRGITHLHHALDACVLALAAHFFPRHGTVWATMVKAGIDREADDDRRLWLAMTKRRPTPQEAALLKATGLYKADAEGRMHLDELPLELRNQLRQRLAEKRVVQHVPADMSGVKTEENTRRVLRVREDGRVDLCQQAPRDTKTGVRPPPKTTEEAAGKLLGLNPANGGGKLKPQKGVRVITDNFGVAILDHAPEGGEKFVIIPWHKVWPRLQELEAKNSGKMPRVLRNGQLIRVPRGTRAGIWRVISTKNTEAYGLALDLSSPDNLKLDRGNAPIGKLCEDGLEIVKCALVGVDSSQIKVAQAKKRPRKEADDATATNSTKATA
jgi:CRISPR-associated endonuclease Csn1